MIDIIVQSYVYIKQSVKVIATPIYTHTCTHSCFYSLKCFLFISGHAVLHFHGYYQTACQSIDNTNYILFIIQFRRHGRINGQKKLSYFKKMIIVTRNLAYRHYLLVSSLLTATVS